MNYTVTTIVFLSLITFTPPTLAVNHALLIGVSHYENFPAQSLNGPKNDVKLMRKVLLNRGFDKNNIYILADGVTIEQPTKENILKALDDLIQTVEKDDFVYLHFSGHGSQQPVAKDKSRTEPDGRDEIFLPRDAGDWNDEIGLVENAIVDDEIKDYLQKLRQKGAFVWVVFDSCHSGTMTRAPLPIVKNVRDRYVDPIKVLKIPSEKFKTSQTQSRTMSRGSPEEAILERTETDLTDHFVAFYAAQTTETTPEIPLPLAKPRETYGLFTYTVAELLENSNNITYHQAAQLILNRYAAYNISKGPTPLFEGSLDTTVFGKIQGKVPQQWLIEPDDGQLKINAGQLHQLAEGSILAIVKGPASDEILGYLEITHADIFTSELKSIEYKQKPALALEEIPQGAYTRLIAPKLSFALPVALPPEPKGDIDEKEARARQVLTDLAQGQYKTCLKTEPGNEACVRIRWVDANSTSAYLRLFLKFNKLWLLPSDAQWIELGDNKTASIRLDKTESELRETLIDSLRRIARVRNLLYLADLVRETGKNDPDFKINVDFCSKEKNHDDNQPVCESPNASLFPIVKHYQNKLPLVSTDPSKDTAIKFSLENSSRKYTDLTLLYIDSQYGMQIIFPKPLESSRIEAHGQIKNAIREINVNMTAGKEYLILISTQAKSNREETRFDFLSQESIPLSRRGLSELYDLLSAAVFGVDWEPRLIRGKSLEQASIQVFSWRKVLPGAVDMALDHLLREGEQAYDASNYSAALEKWQAGLEKARENDYPRYLSIFLGQVGLVHKKNEQFQQALSAFQEALEIRRKLYDIQGEIKSLINLGEIHLELQHYEQACEFFEKTLAIIDEIKKDDKRRIADNLYRLGDIYFELAQYEPGRKCYQRARILR